MAGGLLDVTLRKRDAMAEEPAAPAAKPVDNKAFFKPVARPTAAEKAKSDAKRDKLINKRDADIEAYTKAWDKE